MWGLWITYDKLWKTLKVVIKLTNTKTRQAELDNVGGLRYNCEIPTTKGNK